jgi:hypothetical protein
VNPLAERYRGRLECDCCGAWAEGTIGSFPYYVCAAHAELTNSELIAAYNKKHGVASSSQAKVSAHGRLSQDPNRPLTALMVEALRKAATPDRLGSWDYAAGVLGALKRAGLVEVESVLPSSRYRTTKAGERRLGMVAR